MIHRFGIGEMDLEKIVREEIARMFRPRLICVCGDFHWNGDEDMDFYRCRCRGWMSKKRIYKGEAIL